MNGLDFIATFRASDHKYRRQERYEADDIDHALEQAIDACPADEFVIAIWQAEALVRDPFALAEPQSRDREALDQLNLLLSAPEWPGASGMEDVCQIVRATGREEVADAPAWGRH